MDGYDIIGDVHGCADELEQLLMVLGYEADAAGVYRHPQRSLIFVGDLIDRGPGQLRVLEIVKAASDAGAAQVVMGNHEFNAIAFHTPGSSDGDYLRAHSDKNVKQHAAFPEQVPDEQKLHYLDWFLSIPLWLDLGDLRVVHACWHDESIKAVERILGSNRFSSRSDIATATDRSDDLFRAVDVLLKGPELDLSPYDLPSYVDKGGHPRNEARLRWWVDGATTISQLAHDRAQFHQAGRNPVPGATRHGGSRRRPGLRLRQRGPGVLRPLLALR